jgi:hypothetical protein
MRSKAEDNYCKHSFAVIFSTSSVRTVSRAFLKILVFYSSSAPSLVLQAFLNFLENLLISCGCAYLAKFSQKEESF